MNLRARLTAALALSCLLAFAPLAGAFEQRPKLIVMMVIDQFRADYLMRFQSRFLPARQGAKVGGFRYLMASGAYWPFGQYDLLQCMTAPGHSTVLTGSYPYQNGIPINYWLDHSTDDGMYSAEDRQFPTVGATPKDPHAGTSPKNLIATTLGDELKNAGYPSRVVSLALKDRAAILMGGHRADLALWHDTDSRRWVSSRFYLPDGKLPEWVEKLNAELKERANEEITWKPEGTGTGYSAPSPQSLTGKDFPFSAKLGSHFALTMPLGLELTEQAAERAIDAYKLGGGQATDLFAVSFSSHDLAGHAFGPNSREMEEMTVAEDRQISKLLNHLQAVVPGGLRDVIVVLTGDHGIPPNPDYAKDNRIDSGRIDEEALTRQLEDWLVDKHGKPKAGDKWVLYNHDFNIYLNLRAIAAKGLDAESVLNEVKALIRPLHGIAHVVTSYDIAAGRIPPGQLGRQLLHSYYPGRSADILAIPLPYWMIQGGDTVTHLTGYSYDRTVPLILSGWHIRPGAYATRAEIVDIAPTLAFLSGVIPPALSEGRVLDEAVVTAGLSGASGK